MLRSLRIENFAIVDLLELDFTAGMTVFTGETGAGKSIMIDALMLALGEKSDSSIIRQGAEKCEIHATFFIASDSAPAVWLSQHDLFEDNAEILLRRIIYAEGRSKCYINGQPFPLQKVKELSEMLVDIHGQHQHQTLLQHATHRHQLDQYAKHTALLDTVKQCYLKCQHELQMLEALSQQETTAERHELLQYQINELAALAMQENETQTLYEEHLLLHHAREYLENSQKITDLLAAEEQPNVRQGLYYALQTLSSLPTTQKHIINATELLNTALIQCDEALNEMAQFASNITLDPVRLAEVEARMSELHQMARKYHVDVAQLPAHLMHLQQELDSLQHIKFAQQQLQAQYEQSIQQYRQAAKKLSESRHEFAEKLAAEITKLMQQLGMPQGYIKIIITPLDKMQSHGMDKIEYQVCTNPGTAPDTLAKIASGGELSRISLAIQMITAERGSTPTLIFDEVDVGIGGATAALVGQLLQQVGHRLQVFCVTHQPQVAAFAEQQFKVAKYTQHEQTFLQVLTLTPTARIDEIARMLGGLTITEQTRSHARELLEYSEHLSPVA